MLSRPQPLLRELEHALPDRPFAVRLWDGSTLPATNGGGPTFEVRSPDALAHALLSPGQLGLSRAYVCGALDIDDLDAVLQVLAEWQPPAIERREQAKLALAAARCAGCGGVGGHRRAAAGGSQTPPRPRHAPSAGAARRTSRARSFVSAAAATRPSGTRARCATTTTCRTSSSSCSSAKT